MSDAVIVTEVPAPTGLELPDDSDVVIFPDVVQDDRGTYPVAAAVVADELEAANISVRTWHDHNHADWDGDREAVLTAVVVGVVSAAAWDGIKWMLAKRKNDLVEITLVYRHDGTTKSVRAKGKGRAVADVLEKLRAGPPP